MIFHCAFGGTLDGSKDNFRGQQNVRLLGANLMLFLWLLDFYFASEILIQILTVFFSNICSLSHFLSKTRKINLPNIPHFPSVHTISRTIWNAEFTCKRWRVVYICLRYHHKRQIMLQMTREKNGDKTQKLESIVRLTFTTFCFSGRRQLPSEGHPKACFLYVKLMNCNSSLVVQMFFRSHEKQENRESVYQIIHWRASRDRKNSYSENP